MTLPIYQPRKVNPSNANLSIANPGLVYNKFLDKWPSSASDSNFKSLEGQEKTCWIDSFVSGGPYGKADVLKGASQRLERLALANGARKPEIYASTGPFVTGMGLSHPVENGFLWHHTLGVPYLPGSSVKGLIKAWARDWLEPDEEAKATIDRLFGRDSTHENGASAGSLIVFDALPVEPVNLVAEVLTPHDGGWRIATNASSKDAPADWISPVPIPFLAVDTGTHFQFAFGVRANAEASDLDLAYDYLSGALEWIGAGAKTAIGFGRFFNPEEQKRKENEKFEAWIPKKGEIASTYNRFDEEITVEIKSQGAEGVHVCELGEKESFPVDKEELVYIAASLDAYKKGRK